MNTRNIGFCAEQFACKYLEKKGLICIDSNFRCKGGEIDLVMRDQEYVVFVEVRYRAKQDFDNILETITTPKQQRIIFAAKHFLLEHQWFDKVDCRFDVFCLNDYGHCLWIPNAFEVEYH